MENRTEYSFLNQNSKDESVPIELVTKLKDIAPVYYGYGNHEYGYLKNKYKVQNEDVDVEVITEREIREQYDILRPALEAAGAVVLENDYLDTDINGVPVRIGGLYNYAFQYIHWPVDEPNFMEEFCATDRMKILISHRPDGFLFDDGAEYWDVDLVVSGHEHGGQVILPFVGGFYGGDLGYFPKYVHGMFELGKIHLFVTSGLGSQPEILPRFNNPPEIAVIEISGV